MKLSTKGRYGLRLLFELGRRDGEGPIFLKDIARSQGISEKYLSKLIISLRLAGLVNSVRGAYGGYTLARKPAEITVLEVMIAMEGDIAIVDCVSDADYCPQIGECVFHDLWTEIDGAVRGIMKRVTLQDILDNHQLKQSLTEVSAE